jgi:hypothetical protein
MKERLASGDRRSPERRFFIYQRLLQSITPALGGRLRELFIGFL